MDNRPPPPDLPVGSRVKQVAYYGSSGLCEHHSDVHCAHYIVLLFAVSLGVVCSALGATLTAVNAAFTINY
jgi:hypothetical protein